MSRWNHPMCVACWNERHPDRDPVCAGGLAERSLTCCFCQEPTIAGIFVRADPVDVPCAGVHFDQGDTQ